MTSEIVAPDNKNFPVKILILVMLLALIARLLLLASGAVSFHADEAIVGLMARHILQGERPTFFYGQPYMGSLDAWLIAIGFRLLGESVMTIRIVQSILYMLVVASGFVVAWRFSGRGVIAAVTALMLAVPPTNVALYTTATLGGYNETLLLGNILLPVAYDLVYDQPQSWIRWSLLGFCAGVGWWTNGLIIVYVLPIGFVLLYKLIRGHTFRQALPFIGLALVMFLIGSAPWWVFDFQHNHAALNMYLSNRQRGEFEGIGIPYVAPPDRAIGLLVIGLPALIGMRFPWASEYFLPLIGIMVMFIYGAAIYRILRIRNPLKPYARALTLGMLGLFCLLFVASTFGADSTGRYFLPLTLPLGILVGSLITGLLPEHGVRLSPRYVLPFALLLLVVGYQAAGQISAASTSTGLTTQFDPVSHIPNDHDQELIAFLDEHGLTSGYSNYWVAFRLAFLSDEHLQYRSALPYKVNLSYNAADDRYQPYHDAAASSEQVAYITTNLPELDTLLEAAFAEQGLTYQQRQIGLFHIYYDFQPRKPSLEMITPHFLQTGS